MRNEKAPVTSNVQVGPRLHVMTLAAPQIAREVLPGQFVHMLVPDFGGHVLRRPFSVYAANAEEGTLEVLYQVVGAGTEHMASLAAGACSPAELIGPVGQGWRVPAGVRRALLVGGGVGAAPLFMLCERLVSAGVRVDVVLGAQTEAALVCRERYEALVEAAGAGEVRCATDDGSFGRAGFCTSLVEEALAGEEGATPYDAVYVCGPEPLMKIVASIAKRAGVPAQVSMEKRMACGVGACLSCVVDTASGKKRSCVDGPVFDAEEVVW